MGWESNLQRKPAALLGSVEYFCRVGHIGWLMQSLQVVEIATFLHYHLYGHLMSSQAHGQG